MNTKTILFCIIGVVLLGVVFFFLKEKDQEYGISISKKEFWDHFLKKANEKWLNLERVNDLTFDIIWESPEWEKEKRPLRLHNIYRANWDGTLQIDIELDKLITVISLDPKNIKQLLTKQEILPVVRNCNFINQMEAWVVSKTLVDDLCLSYILNNENHIAYLTEEILKNMEIESNENVETIAQKNLDQYFSWVSMKVHPYQPLNFLFIKIDGNFESSLILQKKFLEEIISEFKSTLWDWSSKTLFAIPSKDNFYVIFTNEKSKLEKIKKEQIEDIYENRSYTISDKLYYFDESGELKVYSS